jgi:DNA-directed RNA polymerase specialized sigma24 family protein
MDDKQNKKVQAKYFWQITTEWTKLENVKGEEGVKGLANDIVAVYFYPMAFEIERRYEGIDGFRALDLASEVIYDLIKNDYKTLGNLERDKGSLRGFLLKVMKDKLKSYRRKKSEETGKDSEVEYEDMWGEFSLDFKEAMKELEEENPMFYKAFYLHHIEEKKKVEVMEILQLSKSMVDHRINGAVEFLRNRLRSYRQNEG